MKAKVKVVVGALRAGRVASADPRNNIKTWITHGYVQLRHCIEPSNSQVYGMNHTVHYSILICTKGTKVLHLSWFLKRNSAHRLLMLKRDLSPRGLNYACMSIFDYSKVSVCSSEHEMSSFEQLQQHQQQQQRWANIQIKCQWEYSLSLSLCSLGKASEVRRSGSMNHTASKNQPENFHIILILNSSNCCNTGRKLSFTFSDTDALLSLHALYWAFCFYLI